MNELQILIEQMVLDISHQTHHLDEIRLQMFLNWLSAHGGRLNTARHPNRRMKGDPDGHLKTILKEFLESIPLQSLLSEYRLLLNEIDWWRNFLPLDRLELQES